MAALGHAAGLGLHVFEERLGDEDFAGCAVMAGGDKVGGRGAGVGVEIAGFVFRVGDAGGSCL